jgi:H+/Cl- antiporter ClcA
VVAAAALLIVGYLFLLNAFGELYGAGQGWDNPLIWLACALSALVVLVVACWALTRFAWWITGRKSGNQQ